MGAASLCVKGLIGEALTDSACMLPGLQGASVDWTGGWMGASSLCVKGLIGEAVTVHVCWQGFNVLA